MIQIKNLVKTYQTGDFVQKALNQVSLNFREHEFVAILGPSGSGKTTFLNVVGGLDRYDSGDILIGKTSTKTFSDKQWDAFRNKSVGFVFQSYNLISHLSIMDNIELAMTLGKVNKRERHQKTLEVLEKVGLIDHAHKKPNQLSGGQMQRVAIARALVNNPDIILMDEPTGALDSETSIQVLDLIKSIAQEKLVVMVTHNQELAQQYANRIVEFKDGQIVGDTNPYEIDAFDKEYQVNRTTMNFWTALKLSFKNILTKKWRTALTAFASSIGIIGVALILSLSNGFDKQINEFETNALSNYPLTIQQRHMNLRAGHPQVETDLEEYSSENKLYAFDLEKIDAFHINKIDQNFSDYLSKLDDELIDGYAYSRSLQMNLLVKDNQEVKLLNNLKMTSFPMKKQGDYSAYLSQYYDLLAGHFPEKETDLILLVDSHNRINKDILLALGWSTDEITFEDLLGKELKVVLNDDFYEAQGPIFSVKQNLDELYKSESNMTLTISGIIRIKEENVVLAMPRGLYYADQFAQELISKNKNSDIVKAQKETNHSVLTGQPFNEELTQEMMLTALGENDIPTQISIYPKTFEAKTKIMNYLDDYNLNKSKQDQIKYTDMAQLITDLTGNIMNGITLVLVAFAGISLIVSMIMIGIIIYISVLERTKEIGILRALGARKKDITRVFNAETFIIGLFSGLLGIGLAYLLTFPINQLILKYTKLENVAQLNPLHAVLLIVIAVSLTIIGGFIPSKMAAKKDPVAALRQE